MKIGKFEKKLNKWQFVFYLGESFKCAPPMKRFALGIFKIHTMPSRGEIIGRKNYKGFIFDRDFKIGLTK